MLYLQVKKWKSKKPESLAAWEQGCINYAECMCVGGGSG